MQHIGSPDPDRTTHYTVATVGFWERPYPLPHGYKSGLEFAFSIGTD